MTCRSSMATGARVRARRASSFRGRPARAARDLARSLVQMVSDCSRRAGARTVVHAKGADARGDLECPD